MGTLKRINMQTGAVEESTLPPSEEVVPHHEWDGSAWVYQFSAEQVAAYRDSKILDVELTVNMPDESEVVIVNNLRTIAAIDSKMKSMDAESSIETVKFEFANGVRDTTYADFQQVMFARERFEQRAFAAYFTILENHQSTPYADEQSWKDDFDMEWEE